jgi:hypothetical protein
MLRRVQMWCAATLLVGLAGCSNELKVSSVEPPQGTFAGGEEVTIRGNGFQPGRGGVTVRFGLREASSVVVASAEKISVTTPGGDPNTTVDVTVIFDDGKAFKLGNGFHYMAAANSRATMDKAFNQMGKKDDSAKPVTPPPPAEPKK